MADSALRETSLCSVLGLTAHDAPGAERYRVSAVIGEGGMGRVFLGRDLETGREVAIKVMINELSEVRGAGERFHREAKALMAVNHPNVLKIIAYSGRDAKAPYLVMERLAGRELEHYVSQGPLPEKAVVALAHEMAQALSVLHERGIIHRDIKPENIMLEPDGRPVLIDFGLAKGIRAGDGTFVAAPTALVGTPIFGSPEQLLGSHALSVRSDLYSLGATLYYAASQVHPFRGDSIAELFASIANDTPVPLPMLVECGTAFWEIVERLLKRAPDERFANAAELLAALGPLKRTLHPQSPQAVLLAAIGPRHHTGLTLTSISDRPATGHDARAKAEERAAATRVVAFTGNTVDTNARGGALAKRWILIAALILPVLASAAAWFARPHPSSMPNVGPAVSDLPAPASQGATGNGTLRIVVIPWGKVWVDGHLIGTTPVLREVVLNKGAHLLEVAHPKFGHRAYNVEMTDDEQTLRVDLEKD